MPRWSYLLPLYHASLTVRLFEWKSLQIDTTPGFMMYSHHITCDTKKKSFKIWEFTILTPVWLKPAPSPIYLPDDDRRRRAGFNQTDLTPELVCSKDSKLHKVNFIFLHTNTKYCIKVLTNVNVQCIYSIEWN